MFDFRLKVFDTVARRLNFTKAAEELYISQPAVTKHIKELEKHFKQPLFERNGNKVALTLAGQMLLKHTDAMLEISKQLEYELNLLNESHKGRLKLGASTTLAQYVLPPILAKFHGVYKEVQLRMITANTEHIEQALLKKEIELGVIEGESKRREIHYTPFARDEIVLVSSAKNPLAKKDELKPDDLEKIPLLLREPGSGTLEVVIHALKKSGINISKLNVEMYLGSTESIKSYLMHSNCLSFISKHAVLKELEAGSLKQMAIKKLQIPRQFFFISRQGADGGLPSAFMRFALQNYQG
ncbi:transcriptional regulator, LysR family [Chloroherpeton thalassium ATCC 35110]|uniref:Transcriptional regulator, LysR family n=1 Tax=Chloroherpeton thalassium (strain ATCC 35110 / GB-78) TaxID=517418 RepID=B3QTU7_CHLT3|nr:LysR family transcriptional regulator [Chloroherpeton thalassium]ACF14295.1 transcriptional regulator, LysR family [Chloroherpeton thalassium ATCC 35110]